MLLIKIQQASILVLLGSSAFHLAKTVHLASATGQLMPHAIISPSAIVLPGIPLGLWLGPPSLHHGIIVQPTTTVGKNPRENHFIDKEIK